jgi:hypothetical protein
MARRVAKELSIPVKGGVKERMRKKLLTLPIDVKATVIEDVVTPRPQSKDTKYPMPMPSQKLLAELRGKKKKD